MIQLEMGMGAEAEGGLACSGKAISLTTGHRESCGLSYFWRSNADGYHNHNSRSSLAGR